MATTMSTTIIVSTTSIAIIVATSSESLFEHSQIKT